MNSRTLKILSLFAVTSVMVSMALMAVRGYYAISFTEPLQGATKGGEFETLYSIWKYIFGGIVYSDQTEIPFAGSYYNWLFYAVYGEITDLFLKILSLGDEWLPTINRLITFCGLLAGSFIAYKSFVGLLDVGECWLKALCGAFALFIFFGPLIGFFGISASPDIWPLVFNVLALWLFIQLYESRPLETIFFIIVLSYLSWAFKQNFIFIPATVGLHLLIKQRWRDAFILTAAMCATGIITLVAGGATFSKMLYFGGTYNFLSLDTLIRNAINFFLKSSPILSATGAILLVLGTSREARQSVAEELKKRPEFLVLFWGVLITFVEAVLTSAINFASENHYFTFSYYLAFAVVTLTVWMVRGRELPNFFCVLLILGWVGNIFASGSVLTGMKGILSVRPVHQDLMSTRLCLKDVRRPVYVQNPYLALPWMLPGKQHFVVHLNYFSDRGAGIEKEGGGIGGLIDRGYFSTLVLGRGVQGEYDGSDLSLYRPRPESCEGMTIYDRMEAGKNIRP